MIPNHATAKLSDLDLRMVQCVPPGGNWKDIPEDVPSKRLEQIRISFAAGKGSRSTYYGRLLADEPSYTISTHFNRPGNGCFIHYDFAGGQHRLISQREAARLQTFPDSFVFSGPQGSVKTQIGNAVPPLLAFRLARCLPEAGVFVDLFSGAGGSALGFHLAGWHAGVANDVDRRCLETHAANLQVPLVLGDIRDEEVADEVVELALAAFRFHHGPRAVVGGPPCQGFSTAGNRRSMDDERNHLFKQYAHVLKRLNPDYFVFENVTGILNMENGRVFDMVTTTLSDVGYDIAVSTLKTEDHGIPQRRARVIIIGAKTEVEFKPRFPEAISHFGTSHPLFRLPEPPSVRDAICDLPRLSHGQDGSDLNYVVEPMNAFQSYARGNIDAAAYLAEMDGVEAGA